MLYLTADCTHSFAVATSGHCQIVPAGSFGKRSSLTEGDQVCSYFLITDHGHGHCTVLLSSFLYHRMFTFT